MILDTTVLIDLHRESKKGMSGPASQFLIKRWEEDFTISIISVSEFVSGFDDSMDAREFLQTWKVENLNLEIAYVAAALDRELMDIGSRLGENDTWIAAFARYLNRPLVSNDKAFDRVRGLHRISY